LHEFVTVVGCWCCLSSAGPAHLRWNKCRRDEAFAREDRNGAEEENRWLACTLRHAMEPLLHSSIPTSACPVSMRLLVPRL